MVSFYQGMLDDAVKSLADAIARGDHPSRIEMFERHILENKNKLDRETRIASGKLPKGKRQTFAEIHHDGEDEWFFVDRVVGTPNNGDPYFIGVGQGFDVRRVLVYDDYSGESALETAEDKLPRWVNENSEIRILTRALRVDKGVPLGGGDARLVSGKDIRYT